MGESRVVERWNRLANYLVTLDLTLQDASGDQSRMRIPIGQQPDTALLSDLATIMAAALTALGSPGTITNAKVTAAAISVIYERANPSGAINAAYSSVSDGAQLNFANSLGGKGISRIPAPVTGVFGSPPNDDVVLASGPVSAWITFYTGHAAHDVNLLNVYNGGVKTGRHANRRAQHKIG